MKIFVISDYRGNHIARPEAEIFIGLRQLGHVITIMTHPDAEYIQRFTEKGIKIITDHPISRYDPKAIEKIRDELEKGKYDVLQLFNNLAITNGLAAAKKINVKISIYRSASQNMAWYNPVNYLKFYHPRIDGVICNSEEIRQKFVKNPFFKSSKAHTIYKGHDMSWYSDLQPIDIRKRFKISNEALIFATSSNNRRVKGIPHLLRAMNSLPKGLDIHLIILGKDMDTPEHLNLIQNSSYRDRIHLLGFRKDSLNLLKSCDVFILPSLGSESLTKSLIEAMSIGLPSIATNLSGNLPILKDEVNTFLIQPGDSTEIKEAILRVIENRNKLSRMSLAGKQILSEKLNLKKTIQEYENYFAWLTNR